MDKNTRDILYRYKIPKEAAGFVDFTLDYLEMERNTLQENIQRVDNKLDKVHDFYEKLVDIQNQVNDLSNRISALEQ